MTPKMSDYADYVSELHTRLRRLSVHPLSKIQTYEYYQDERSDAMSGGPRVLYGARVSILGKAFDTRKTYRTAKEANNRVACRALDFIEGWEQGRGLGLDHGLNLAASLPYGHPILTERPEDYARDSFSNGIADLTVDQLVKNAIKLVVFFPIGNKFYVYRLAVKLAQAMLDNLKQHSLEVTTIVAERFIDIIEDTIEDCDYEDATYFQPEEQREDVVLAGKPLRAVELFAEQAIHIGTMDTSEIGLSCNTFDLATEFMAEVFINFPEQLSGEFSHQLRRKLHKALQRRKDDEARADHNDTQRANALPDGKFQPETQQSQSQAFVIRTKPASMVNPALNGKVLSTQKHKADAGADMQPDLRQKMACRR